MTTEPVAQCQAMIAYEPIDPLARAQAWAAMTPGERRRRATAACQYRDRAALGELLIGYMLAKSRARAQSSPHTMESYNLALTSLLIQWPEEPLLHPSPDAGDRFVTALSREGCKPSTVAARLAGAKAFYRALRWCRATDADPFADVRSPRDATPRHERRYPYSESDIAALLDVAIGTDRVLILLCGHAGLRIAEALDLRWTDIDLPHGRLRVTAGKGRKDRTVILSASLLAALRALEPAGDQAHVICSIEGLPFADPTVPRRHLQRMCRQAGVTYLGFHSLRHSAGTRLARQTGNLQLVAAHLGHADVSTAAIYAKWSDDTLRKAVQDW
jgi:integrase